MNWSLLPAVLLSLCAGVFSLMISLYGWRRSGHSKVIHPFVIFSTGIGIWAIAYSMEIFHDTLEDKLFWSNLQFFGVGLIPLGFLAFALYYTNRERWLTRPILALLTVEPLVTLALVYSNPIHQLVRVNPRLVDYDHFVSLAFDLGNWYWVNNFYVLALVLVGSVLIIRYVVTSHHLYKEQSATLLIGVLAPLAANVLGLAQKNPFSPLDLTVYAFLVTNMAFAWAIFQYRLLSIVPIARDTLVENLPDSVIVLDQTGRIIDVNPAAQEILGLQSRQAIGRPAQPLLSNRFSNLPPAPQETFCEVGLTDRQPPRTFELRISSISNRQNFQHGWLYDFRDISRRKHAEQAEREQRALAEALRDTAAALNSTLKFDEVLDRILDNIRQVVPHDADTVDIILLDAARQSAQLARHRDTRDLAHAVDVTTIQFSISQMRNLREMQATGAPVIIADTSAYDGWIDTPLTAWIRANLGVPIKIKGETIGFLSLNSATPNAFTPLDADRLRAFADQAAIAIENAWLYEEVQELAITDALTGVFNRRGLVQLGEREVERALRFQHPLAIVMLDIDHFKRVNDTYGHLIGDRVLRALADCCRAQVRNVDVVARYGGEEFVLLLPETDVASAAQVAERLQQVVEQMVVSAESDKRGGGKTVQVTVSQGVVMVTPDTPNLTALLERVDRTLYRAKQSGRNCVAVDA